MEKLIKQCLGIDISQNDIDVTFGTYDIEQNVQYISYKKFKNNEKSFEKLLKWAQELSKADIPLFFIMEATGVYHEKLCYFLYEREQKVIVVLPNKAANYAKTLETKTVTDKEASKYLTRMGLEKKLKLWIKPNPVYNLLKQLTRERSQLQKAKTVTKNQVHSEKESALSNTDSLKRAMQRIKMLENQIADIESEIEDIINQYPELKRKTGYLTSITGVGLITAATVIGETDGFLLIENKRQLVSYCGYDIKLKESGSSVHAKPRISKRGNRHIRKALHFPALSSIRYDNQNKQHFTRLVQKHGIKMKAAVAIQRKVLVLMFTLWKNEQMFNPNYMNTKKIGQTSCPKQAGTMSA